MLSAVILIFVIQGGAVEWALTLDALELARTAGDLIRTVQLTGGRDITGIIDLEFVAVAIAPGASPLHWTRSIR